MITDVRIELPPHGGGPERDNHQSQVLAYAVVTFTLEGKYSFVINDIKIIQNGKARFVAMPSRLRMERCPACRAKTPMTASYCWRCGHRVEETFSRIQTPKRSLHSDIAHPIDKISRNYLQAIIFAKFDEALRLAQRSGH